MRRTWVYRALWLYCCVILGLLALNYLTLPLHYGCRLLLCRGIDVLVQMVLYGLLPVILLLPILSLSLLFKDRNLYRWEIAALIGCWSSLVYFFLNIPTS